MSGRNRKTKLEGATQSRLRATKKLEGAAQAATESLKNFWENRRLEELSPEEWELLCDGCGRCCLIKIEDFDTGRLSQTSVACSLLDSETCRCANYSERQKIISDCVILTPETVPTLAWLPSTCAYKLVEQGLPLPHWHPLCSGDQQSVHREGISVRNKVISEEHVSDDQLENFVIGDL